MDEGRLCHEQGIVSNVAGWYFLEGAGEPGPPGPLPEKDCTCDTRHYVVRSPQGKYSLTLVAGRSVTESFDTSSTLSGERERTTPGRKPPQRRLSWMSVRVHRDTTPPPKRYLAKGRGARITCSGPRAPAPEASRHACPRGGKRVTLLDRPLVPARRVPKFRGMGVH